MNDKRLMPANGRVAAAYLRGRVEAETFVTGWQRVAHRPVVDLRAAPNGARDRQILLGEIVTVYEDHNGWSFVQASHGYVGYVLTDALGPIAQAATHFVATPATHAYAQETMKSEDLLALPFGSRLHVVAERRSFFETDHGYVPKKHMRALDRPFQDAATVAQMHFGVPYLWGGDSTRGIDCSGLVHAALTACGLDCPADSDQQQAALGHYIAGGAPMQRGDLVFWDGHVGMMVDDETMIHANAHHMAVVYEPLARAILRIDAQGDGPVTARKRLI